jgi:N-acetylneuraminic acid mutarotase
MYSVAIHQLIGWLAIAALALKPVLGQTWIDLAPIPIGTIQEHSTVLLSETLLATVGGIYTNTTTANDLLLYDIPSNTWSHGAPIPVPLNHPNTAVHGGKLYVLGGLAGSFPWVATSAAYVYDVQNDSWSPIAGMPTGEARGSAASAVHNGTIYLAGGETTINGPTVDIVSAYHIPSDQWIPVPEPAARLPAGRDHMAYAQIGTKFYVLGGRENGQTNVKDTVFILDLADLAAGWKTSTARMPTARGGLTGAAIGRKIYTFGGEGNPAPNSSGVFNQTEMYDSVTDTWTRLPAMQVPRHGTSAVAAGGKVYIPGGGIMQGAGGVGVFNAFVPRACRA